MIQLDQKLYSMMWMNHIIVEHRESWKSTFERTRVSDIKMLEQAQENNEQGMTCQSTIENICLYTSCIK